MNGTSSQPRSLLRLLLDAAQRNGDQTLRLADLRAVSAEETKRLLDARILRPTAVPAWHQTPGQPRMRVQKLGDRYCLVDPNAPGRTPLMVELNSLQRVALDKPALLALVIADTEVKGSPSQIGNGLWHLGRKSIPGKGLGEVHFVEDAACQDALETAMTRSATKMHCFAVPAALRHRYLRLESAPQRVAMFIEFTVAADGKFAADWSEQAEALSYSPSSLAEIDLDARPPAFRLNGTTLTLPSGAKGQPSKGSKILDYLFQHPRQPHKCFELEAAVSRDFEQAFQAQQATDVVADKKYLSAIRQSLTGKRQELAAAQADQSASPAEITELELEINELEFTGAGLLGHRSKPIELGQREIERSRNRVRKALNDVVRHVTAQSQEIGMALENALNLGYEVMFTPPQSWGL